MKMRRLLVISAFAFGSALALTFVAQQRQLNAPITAKVVASAPKIPAAMRSLRPNYPYSIIPGGAYSPAELRVVDQRDPMVREHYADFNVSAARLVMLTEDRYQYVSFKLNNKIYWTRKKLRIPKGEILLTDGRNYARTRCGNRLSSIPQMNTTSIQFPEFKLSMPPFRPELLGQLPPAPEIGELAQNFRVLPMEMPPITPYLPMGTPGTMNLPATWPPSPVTSPIVPLAPGLTPPTRPTTPITPVIPPNVPVAPVPEPGTTALMGIGLTTALWMWRRRRKAQVGSTSCSTFTE